MLFLSKRILGLCDVASKEAARFSLTAIKIIPQGIEGAFRAEATDGRRLLIIQEGSCTGEVESDPVLRQSRASLPEDADLAEALVPAEDLRKAFRLVKGNGRIALHLGQTHGMIAVGATVTKVEYDEGRFPDVNWVLPKGEPVRTMKMNPALLGSLLKAITPIVEDNAKDNCVTVCFFDDNEVNGLKPIAITGRSDGGILLDGLIMPIV